MAHCEPQTLSLIALGEQPSAEDALHLVTCDICRRDWESMRATVDVARDLDDRRAARLDGEPLAITRWRSASRFISSS